MSALASPPASVPGSAVGYTGVKKQLLCLLEMRGVNGFKEFVAFGIRLTFELQEQMVPSGSAGSPCSLCSAPSPNSPSPNASPCPHDRER